MAFRSPPPTSSNPATAAASRPCTPGRFADMDYTIKNLRDVEDMAEGQGFGDVQEARFAHGDLNAEHTGVSLQRVKPNKKLAFAHRHKEMEEVYVVLTGSGRIKLDDAIEEVGPLDAIRIGPSV